MLNLQTTRLASAYDNIGNAVIKFSLQLFRVFSDKYYTEANEKVQVQKDWEAYLTKEFPRLSLMKAQEYLKIGESFYKYERTLDIDKFATLNEKSLVRIMESVKNIEQELIEEVLRVFQSKLDPDYAHKLFKTVLDSYRSKGKRNNEQ